MKKIFITIASAVIGFCAISCAASAQMENIAQTDPLGILQTDPRNCLKFLPAA